MSQNQDEGVVVSEVNNYCNLSCYKSIMEMFLSQPLPEERESEDSGPPCKKNKELEPLLDTNFDDSRKTDLNISNNSQK